jgi:hypothetical protein
VEPLRGEVWDAHVRGAGTHPFVILTVNSSAQVRDSTGPLNQWPAGHLIIALSMGPSLEPMVNQHLTAAGSPHLTAPSMS